MSDTNASQGERLHYSGMTHATTDDGTPETIRACDGEAPTGHEKVDARAVFGSDADHDGVDLIHRLQPGVAASDSIGWGRKKKR